MHTMRATFLDNYISVYKVKHGGHFVVIKHMYLNDYFNENL